MSEPRIVVVDDAATAAQVAAAHVAGALRSAVDARSRADWATTGGSTAPATGSPPPGAVRAAGFRYVTLDLAGLQSGAFTLPLVAVHHG